MTELWSGIFALGGVLIGAVLALVIEVWKRVLDGQAAARVIRVEMVENRVIATGYLQHGTVVDGTGVFDATAWNAYRLVMAPLLTEMQLADISACYARQDRIMQEMLSRHATPKPVQDWVASSMAVGKNLRAIEGGSRTRLLLAQFFGKRTATKDDIERNFGLTTDRTTGKVPERDAEETAQT